MWVASFLINTYRVNSRSFLSFSISLLSAATFSLLLIAAGSICPFIGSISWILSAIFAISLYFCVCAVATTLCIGVGRRFSPITWSISSLIIFPATIFSRLTNCVGIRSPNSLRSSATCYSAL